MCFLVCAAGCVQREGRNSDCRWPAEVARRGVAARHLSADAELAEDLAVRHADTHNGLRTERFVSGKDYDAAREACLSSLFETVAKTHSVPVATVASSLGENRAYIDAAEILPFALLCCFGAALVAPVLWRRYPPIDNGWIPTMAMMLFASLVFAGAALLLGEVWCWVLESNRIGNHHMSYRLQRLWWVRHRGALFLSAIIVFGLAGLGKKRGSG